MAASSRPDPKRESRAGELLTEARAAFPARRKLYSVDGLGRRYEIDTGQMSEGAYLSLLEAIQSPVRYDGEPPERAERATGAAAPREVAEGFKSGRETGLPLPEWWELPEAGASVEEIISTIRRNLKRAARQGGGIFKTWGR